ncbi:MAG: molybdopterin cofactor-binding domain-containing protein [Pseudomonadota bacterium]
MAVSAAITRRGLLTGAAVGGGLLVAWWLFPRNFPNPLVARKGEHIFDAWLKIAEDGVVTVAVPQLEMGQGVTTLLPQIVAQELGADWRQIAVEPAPVSGAYANIPLARKWSALWDGFGQGMSEASDEFLAAKFARDSRFSATADGTSIAAFEEPCRYAAASARAMLAQAGAARWGVEWEQCEVENGFVRYGDDRLTFGQLAAEAATQDAPDPPPLLPDAPGERPQPGEADALLAFPRIDMPSKVDGTYQFAGDVRLPRMAYAAIRHGPVDNSVLSDFEQGRPRGAISVVEGKRWIAAIASNWWQAERALSALKPQFTTEFPVDSDAISARLDTMVDGGESFRIAETGSGEEGMTRVDFARRYEVEAAIPAPVETACATARFEDGTLELWMAAQAPERARMAAARAINVALENVVLYPMSAGGSFDRRLEHDHAIEAALIAREFAESHGRPVQLTWSRREEIVGSRPRTPAYLLLGAQLSTDGEGRIEALRSRIACPPTNIEFGKRLFDNLTTSAAVRESVGAKDSMACEGAVPPYAIPSVVVDHIPVEIGLPTGRMRGNSHSYTAFATESLIDEIAADNSREPLSYRIAMLGDDVRLVACLQRAAQLAEWGGGGGQSGQGLACHRIGDAASGGRIACIATARQSEGGVRVSRLSAAVDIGRIINLDIARQQIEGGLIFGLSLALGNAIRYRAGLPTALDMDELGLPTLADCPEIEIEFIASEAAPADPGELGAVVAAPAIANALFSATGLRLRRLPLLSGGI